MPKDELADCWDEYLRWYKRGQLEAVKADALVAENVVAQAERLLSTNWRLYHDKN